MGCLVRKSKIALLSVMVAATACGKKAEESKGTVNLNFKANGTSLALDGLALAGNGTFDDLGISTSASSTGTFSLKMYPREIKLCTSLKFASGTGYTIDGTCAAVYSNMTDEYRGLEGPSADERTLMDAAGDGKFYDMLSATDRAKLSKAVAIDTGDYNWGIIEMHPWVKLTAKNGTLCTKKAGAKEETAGGSNGGKNYYTSVTSLACGATDAAQEVLMYITNANSSFKLGKTFSLGKDEEFTVDLGFNLDGEVKTIRDDQFSASGNLRANDAKSAFYVPMIRLNAAPRKAGQTTKVESYTLGTTAQAEQIRVQIYYNSADTSKAVLGINAAVLATAASTTTKANKPVYLNSVTQSGDILTFKSWDDTTVLTMTRSAAGKATLQCTGTGNASALEICTGKTTVDLAYAAPTTADL